MDVKDLKGRPVVAIDGGEQLGTIKDVLFNLDARAVQAITVSSGGLFHGSSTVIAMSDIHSIGNDAVMVPSRDVLRGDEDTPVYRQYPGIKELTSLRVMTKSGEHAGDVSTLRIDPGDGHLIDIEVRRAGAMGVFREHVTVPIAHVISIGKDMVVVPDRNEITGEAESQDQERRSAGEAPPAGSNLEPPVVMEQLTEQSGVEHAAPEGTASQPLDSNTPASQTPAEEPPKERK
ncbi:MAG TPA: PRC-barrel domain-containing protein [Thermomicrobiaceae bacterium]|nr:PRC-barrel domain-containing protein [Thermomicrobiaceae bacterium]